MPTPRGGGLAIVVTTVVALVPLIAALGLDMETGIALGTGGLLVGAVGYLDDRRSLPPLPRIGVHIAAATFAVLTIHFGTRGTAATAELMHWAILLTFIVGVVWSINLFNFMDGIDGLAASQALFVTSATALLAVFKGDASTSALAMLLVSAGACLGFLIWNWPPAKIFMGDAGSGFLGFWLATLAFWLHATDALSIWTSITLNAVFISDATITLLRRMLREERWYEAHRSHAYQILARKWNSHRKVTISVVLLNMAIILPLSVIATLWSSAAPAIAVSCVLILAWTFRYLGAGSKPAP